MNKEFELEHLYQSCHPKSGQLLVALYCLNNQIHHIGNQKIDDVIFTIYQDQCICSLALVDNVYHFLEQSDYLRYIILLSSSLHGIRMIWAFVMISIYPSSIPAHSSYSQRMHVTYINAPCQCPKCTYPTTVDRRQILQNLNVSLILLDR